MLHRLSGGQEPGIESRRTFVFFGDLLAFLDNAVDSRTFLPCGFFSRIPKTCSRRETCSSVSVSCFSNAAFKSGFCAALAILGKAAKIFFSA